MSRAPVLLTPGSTLGKYELVRNLAVGGMAELHLARANGLEGFSKLVVLKRILPQLAVDEQFVKLFLDEARLAAMLHHPNIVEVFDVGQQDGAHFMAMEYVRGENLANVIHTAVQRKRGLTLAHAVMIVAGVAEGLHHAHEQRGPDGEPLGIVHRDVSPTNVMLTWEGRVKVCDFGIAKAVARQAATTVGVRGKVAYMSPEQCRAEPVDRRSDVFAIGILLYELTTGRRLFRGASDYEVMQRIIGQDVAAPSLRQPDYLPALERIVLRALARDPAKRYASAQELQLDLEELARSEHLALSPVSLARYLRELFGEPAIERSEPHAAVVSTPTVPPGGPGWKTWGLRAVAGAALVAGAVAVGMAVRGGARQPPAPPADTVAEVKQPARPKPADGETESRPERPQLPPVPMIFVVSPPSPMPAPPGSAVAAPVKKGAKKKRSKATTEAPSSQSSGTTQPATGATVGPEEPVDNKPADPQPDKKLVRPPFQ